MKRARREWWLMAMLLAAAAAWAGEKGPELKEGVLYGVVMDAESQKPIAGATVAAFDKKGHPLAWGKTDAEGRYAIVTPPLRACNLEKEGRGGGLLVGMVRGTGRVVGGAVNLTVHAARTVAGAAIGQKTQGAAAGVVGGTPGGSGAADQVRGQVAEQAGGAASTEVQQDVGLQHRSRSGKHGSTQNGQSNAAPPAPQPGQVTLKVSLSDYQEFWGPVSVYWMEPAVRQPGQSEVGPQAWLEPVLMAASGKNAKSHVVQTRIMLQDARLEPNLATPGTKVKVSTMVTAPKQAGLDYRVFLVDSRGNAVVELEPSEAGHYAAEFAIPPKHPLGECVLTLAALRTRPVTVDISRAKEDPLPHLAAQLDDLKPGNPYEYDPRILASHNRLDLKLVVLDPAKGVVQPSTIPTERKPEPTPVPPEATKAQPADPSKAQPPKTESK